MTSPPAAPTLPQNASVWAARAMANVARAGVCVLLLFSCGPDHDGARFAWESPELQIGMLPGPEDSWMTPEVLDTSALHVLTGLTRLDLPLWTMAEATRSARVEVSSTHWACIGAYGGPAGKATCEGQQYDFRLRVAKENCVWMTAFMHELTHMLLEQATGDPDAQHQWKEAWAPSGDQLGPCPGDGQQKPAMDVVGG